MDASILLADAVTNNHDGTVSALRCGLNVFDFPSLPAYASIGVVISVQFQDESELGEHRWEMHAKGPSGEAVRIAGGNVSGAALGPTIAGVPATFGFKDPGERILSLHIDGNPVPITTTHIQVNQRQSETHDT